MKVTRKRNNPKKNSVAARHMQRGQAYRMAESYNLDAPSLYMLIDNSKRDVTILELRSGGIFDVAPSLELIKVDAELIDYGDMEEPKDA